MQKILIAYYSFEGTTRKVAELMAQSLEADLLEIRPVKELKSKGFSKYLWGGSQVVMGKKPELVAFEKDPSAYETILIGSPIWAGNFAPPIKTLIEDGEMKGKSIAYFYCHEGGPGKTEEKTKAAIEGNNTYLGAHGFVAKGMNAEQLKSEIESWVQQFK